MKESALLAVLIGWTASAAPARAETYDLRLDPSGAPMCFTGAGERALLAHCQVPVTATYVSATDPSGAPMCFTSSGDKAPLSRCGVSVTAVYVTALDPSGAPMCFDEAGDKAPLAHCQSMVTLMSQLARSSTVALAVW
jgi:hypothetical protein